MSNDSTDHHSSFPMYKLFFDDIEEIFLNTLSLRLLSLLTFITCLFMIGILILLFYRSKNILITSLIPFLYALIFYDFFQLVSLILLKYNFTERFLNQFCQWTYYLKSSAEAGQCLAVIFLFAISRHQIRYFLTHHRLPNSSRIHSRALTFVCLLFVVYVNNWITHLKVEKMHLITLNQTKYEITIQELPISLYDLSEMETRSHQQFLSDLEKYAQGQDKNVSLHHSPTSSNKKIIHSGQDGHEIIIKFPYDFLYNPTNNRTKRRFKRQEFVKQDHPKNNSYRINRCTYGQGNFFLANFLSLIHSSSYLILLIYYLITIPTHRITNISVNYHQQSHAKSLPTGRKKSIERQKHVVLLMHLKQFIYLMIYSHTLFTLIRLVYVFSLTLIICFIPTPFQWFPLKIFFYSLFLIGYLSIPLRMSLIFIYLFLCHFATHLQSLILYLFHTNLRFSWKIEKPTLCFRFHCVPYANESTQDEILSNSLAIDVTSSVDEDHSLVIPHDSSVVYDEHGTGYNAITTNILTAPYLFANESTSNASVIAKL